MKLGICREKLVLDPRLDVRAKRPPAHDTPAQTRAVLAGFLHFGVCIFSSWSSVAPDSRVIIRHGAALDGLCHAWVRLLKTYAPTQLP
jgi:hypothetical protein